MGFSFRKRIKIGKGLHLNISKSGIGLNIGKKSANITIEPDGDIVGNVGIPGSGLSYRKKLVDKDEDKE